jgi:hypothetical protein
MVENPTLRFSNMAAGIMRMRVTQLQFFPNHPLRTVLKMMIMVIESRLQGNNKNHEAFSRCVGRGSIKVSIGYNRKLGIIFLFQLNYVKDPSAMV